MIKRFPLTDFSELHFKTDACIKIFLQIEWLIDCIENFNMCITSAFDSYLVCKSPYCINFFSNLHSTLYMLPAIVYVKGKRNSFQH